MTHDIIDNRREELADHIQAILPQSDAAWFAAGHRQTEGTASQENKERARWY